MDLEFKQKIQKIREAVNIVDIVGEYLKLTRKGSNFWAICPFHEDSNPSLAISQDKQIYKCFACGEQGNVFIFLQKYKNIDFLTSLKEVAKFAKLDLKDFDLAISEEKKSELHKFKELHDLAVSFYQYQLTTAEGKSALGYLQERNISEANINDFGLGYAPSNNQLLDYLILQGYEQIDLIESGLTKITDADKVKDMFFNRIMFPIVDLDGHCIGFSARKYLIKGKDSFKYINTPETEIFKKGQVLYNLYNAKKAVSVRNGNIYLVEGYMDVISLTNQGIQNCVALMGTNLTKEHMVLLKKITNNIVIFLDGDEAGKTAANKIAINLLANDFDVKIVDNPTTSDPDELINQNITVFQEIIGNPVHPLAFAIKFFAQKYDVQKDSAQLKAFLEQLKPMWQVVRDAVTVDFYLESLHQFTNLSVEQLRATLKVTVVEPIVSFASVPRKQARMLQPLSFNQKLLEVEKELFFLLLLDRSAYQFLEEEKYIFQDKRLMALYFLVSQKYQENKQLIRIDQQDLLVSLKENEIFAFLAAIINKYQTKNYQVKKAILQDYLKISRRYLIEMEISRLQQQISRTTSLDTQIKLLKEMSVLKNKLNE